MTCRARWLLLVVVVALGANCSTPDRPTIGAAAAPAACSADGAAARLDHDGLPSPVARRTRELVAAAVDCDYRRLDCDYRRLDRAARRDGLVVTFDGDEVLPGEWAELEHDGLPVMRALVALLALSPARQGGSVTWPSAVGWRALTDGSPEDQRDLEAFDGDSGW